MFVSRNSLHIQHYFMKTYEDYNILRSLNTVFVPKLFVHNFTVLNATYIHS